MYKIINTIKSIEQYNKKYKHHRDNLVVLTKKEVEEFDLLNNCKGEKRLLNNKKWALIKDTYYEIPKPIRWTWFRNVNAGVQALTCVMLVGGVSAAIAVPTYIAIKGNKQAEEEGGKIYVESDKVTSDVEFDESGNVAGNLQLKDDFNYEIKNVTIKIGSTTLKDDEYTYDDGSILIKADVVKQYKGSVHIIPNVELVKGKAVEEDDFKKIVLSTLSVNTSRNFKLEYLTVDNDEEWGESGYANSINIDREAEEDLGAEKIYKGHGDNVRYLWQDEFNGWTKQDDWMPSEKVFRYMVQMVDNFSRFNFDENLQLYKGKIKLIVETTGLESEMTMEVKFDDEDHITRMRNKFDYIPSSSTVHHTETYKFSQYGSTKIEDLPTDPIPDPYMKAVFDANVDLIDGSSFDLTSFQDAPITFDQSNLDFTDNIGAYDKDNKKIISNSNKTGVDTVNAENVVGYSDTSIEFEIADYSKLDIKTERSEELGGKRTFVKLNADNDRQTIQIPHKDFYVKGKTRGYNIVDTIGSDAFNNSTITTVKIPNTITYISGDAFANATKLASAVFEINDGDSWVYYLNSAPEEPVTISLDDLKDATVAKDYLKGTKVANIKCFRKY